MGSSLQMFSDALIVIAFYKVVVPNFLVVNSLTWNTKWTRENNSWLRHFSLMVRRRLLLFFFSYSKNTLRLNVINSTNTKSFLLIVISNLWKIVLLLNLLFLLSKIFIIDAAFATPTDRTHSRWIIRSLIMKF